MDNTNTYPEILLREQEALLPQLRNKLKNNNNNKENKISNTLNAI